MSLIDDFVTAREACSDAFLAADHAAKASFDAQSQADQARALANEAAGALERRKAEAGYSDAWVAVLARRKEILDKEDKDRSDAEKAELAAIVAEIGE